AATVPRDGRAMSDYLGSIAARQVNAAVIQPRLPARFEPRSVGRVDPTTDDRDEVLALHASAPTDDGGAVSLPPVPRQPRRGTMPVHVPETSELETREAAGRPVEAQQPARPGTAGAERVSALVEPGIAVRVTHRETIGAAFHAEPRTRSAGNDTQRGE